MLRGGSYNNNHRNARCARRYPYTLQCDIVQFFPSIDHAILRDILQSKLSDENVRWLIDRILESGEGVLSEAYEMVYFPGDDLFAAHRPRGLPIGNLTSQFWGNVYLNGFDHFIKRRLRCPAYLRYVDDFLLFGNDKAQLWGWKSAIEERQAALRLTIHPGAQPRPVSEGLPFLGFILFPDKRRLKRRKGIYYQRKLRRQMEAYVCGEVTIEQITASVQGWVNHVRYGNTVGLRKALLGSMPLTRRD